MSLFRKKPQPLRHFYVEVPGNPSPHRVTARSWDVYSGGTLVFYVKGYGEPILTYSPQAWLTVVEEEQ